MQRALLRIASRRTKNTQPFHTLPSSKHQPAMGNQTYFGSVPKLKVWPHAAIGVGAVVATFLLLQRRGSTTSHALKKLQVMTWNIAAINNNPFEYWITHDDAAYNKLMEDVQAFINAPDAQDVAVNQVFTEEMFAELKTAMGKTGWEGLEEVEALWKSDFQHRPIVTGFLKDGKIGKKRLASMPDRMTNTINLHNGGQAYRPTVINCYEGDLGTPDKWWKQWRSFMFEKQLLVAGRDGVAVSKRPMEMLAKIKHAKYPELSEEEERISLPLQTLSCAIFDAIMVHMMNTVAPARWQSLRAELCSALNKNKVNRTLDILNHHYDHSDIIFLQEVSGALANQAREIFDGRFTVHTPEDMDPSRDQNSVVLTKTNKFVYIKEVTSQWSAALSTINPKAPVAKGDLLALSARAHDGQLFLLCSFHGDTNGLATVEVTQALAAMQQQSFTDHKLVFGLDANTYGQATPGKQQSLQEYADEVAKLELQSVWGPRPDASQITTFNARTYLQPQLNKAVKLSDRDVQGDRNLKDFILFNQDTFTVAKVGRDNTGAHDFIQNMVIPSLSFPSDHCILEATLESAL